MASRAASKLLMPPGRLCSDGLKHLVGAVKGPLARSQARYNSSAATENPTSNINQEVGGHERFFSDLVAKHEKTIGELESKYDKALSDLKQGFDRELIVLRYDLKKEAEDRSVKHYIDIINLKKKLTTHELKKHWN